MADNIIEFPKPAKGKPRSRIRYSPRLYAPTAVALAEGKTRFAPYPYYPGYFIKTHGKRGQPLAGAELADKLRILFGDPPEVA